MSIQANVKDDDISNASASAEKKVGRPNLSGELNRFAKDIEALLMQATTLTGEELSQIKARLYARVAEAQERVEGSGEEFSEQSRQRSAAANAGVQQQPWPVMGESAIAGLLLGFALARRL